MTDQTPPFLGLILRKNERTRAFTDRYTEELLEVSPDARAPLNEDERLIAFSVAMNGNGLDSAIQELVSQHAICGEDFVATGSPDGVLGDAPPWLSERTVRLPSVPAAN